MVSPFIQTQKQPPFAGGCFLRSLFLLILALLISDAAARLAGRLARGLALAAAAVLRALAEIAGLYGLYSCRGSYISVLFSFG